MRLHHKVILLSTLFTVNGLIGCDNDDTDSTACILTDDMCQPANKELDKDKCECVKPQCALTLKDCQSANKALDPNKCECVDQVCTLTQSDCHPGQTLDTSSCKCICALTQAECPAGQILDANNCNCIATGCIRTQADCPAGQSLNSESCECVDTACTKTPNDCEPGQSLNSESCECVDTACTITPNDCKPGQTLNTESCECTCSISCPEGQTLDEETCTCSCTLSEEYCTLQNKVFDEDACACTCPITMDECRNANLYLDEESCTCINYCPLKAEQCDKAHPVLDEERCTCQCYLAIGNCRIEGQYFDEPNCRCTKTCQLSEEVCLERNQAFNADECYCNCPISPDYCSNKGKFLDGLNSQCICRDAQAEECKKQGKTLNPYTCECITTDKCDKTADSCTNHNKKFDESICECVCPNIAQKDLCELDGNRYFDEESCVCKDKTGCTTPSTECENKGLALDNDTCQCVRKTGCQITNEMCSQLGGKLSEDCVCDTLQNIYFGVYYGEPIEWLFLEKTSDGNGIYISKKALDIHHYHPELTAPTWKTSSIRSWLNGYAPNDDINADFPNDNFIAKAFTEKEEDIIIPSKVSAEKNSVYQASNAGEDTNDKVFLLSIMEAGKYFPNTEDKLADTSIHARQKGAIVLGSETDIQTLDGSCSDTYCYTPWWLRTSGENNNLATYVNIKGSIDQDGEAITTNNYSVRPAIVLKHKASNKCSIEEETCLLLGGELSDDCQCLASAVQPNETANGVYQGLLMAWRVVQINSKRLYISENVLDVEKYNITLDNVTWEKSTIRSWLNGYGPDQNEAHEDYTDNNFLKIAFPDTSDDLIKTAEIPVSKNSKYTNSDPGNATKDKIFLLSAAEAGAYLPNEKDKKSMAIQCAIDKGVSCNDKFGAWWLRTPGENNQKAAYVSPDGTINYQGVDVNSSNIGIRPAFWGNN